MITYGDAMAFTSVHIGGCTDPAFNGFYRRYGNRNNTSNSFYHMDWPQGAPNQTHVTVAPQGNKLTAQFTHFHISVEINGTNVGIYFTYVPGRNNLRKRINKCSPGILDDFYKFYNKACNWQSIDIIALQFYTKVSGIIVSEVYHSDDGEEITYDVNEDLGPAFRALFEQ
jgi:hypothetical protein